MIYGIVYKITNNVNGKVYIGQTIRPLSERMSQHKCCMNGSSNSYLYKSMRKYGWDNFTWEIVCECSCREELNSKEIEYITLHESHRTRGKGYNLTKGGDFNPMSDPDVRRRQQQTMLISMKAFCGENNVMCRDDVKEKHHQAVISLSKDPNWIESKSKGDLKQMSEYEITFPDGTIEVILGLNRFCKIHNLSQSKMSSVSSGDRTHHKGFKCKRLKVNKGVNYTISTDSM